MSKNRRRLQEMEKQLNRVYRALQDSRLLQFEATEFQSHLINTLERTSLAPGLKQSINNSITLSSNIEKNPVVTISAPEVPNIEFGTLLRTEQPWIRQAISAYRPNCTRTIKIILGQLIQKGIVQ